jgi:choice-of-anchor B domain-containing protein
MKLVVLLAVAAVGAMAAPGNQVTFQHYTDKICNATANATTIACGVCTTHGRTNFMLTCNDDNSIVTEQEYTDNTCATKEGHPRDIRTDQCHDGGGGTHGSMKVECGNALAPKKCLEGCRTDPEGAGGVTGSLMQAQHLMREKLSQWEECFEEGECGKIRKASGRVNCEDGMAGEFQCSGVDMLAFIPFQDLGCIANSNDIWGWTREGDVDAGHEIAIHCCTSGTSFVDISNPEEPVVLAYLPGVGSPSSWRDAKVYQGRVYIISEASNHGMQVYDMHGLPSRASQEGRSGPPPTIEVTFWYSEHGSSHNIYINEETGFAYSIGSRTCAGGLHIIDLSTPDLPVFDSCFSNDGYTHDVECIVHNGKGKNAKYAGHEICYAYNENSLTIVDVTDKANQIMVSRVPYTTSQYTHQGWITDDQHWILMNDELDESRSSFPEAPRTRTLIWDVSDIENPAWVNTHLSPEGVFSIDHNLYIVGNKAYLSNYCSGLRILDLTNLPEVEEEAFFDVAPTCNSAVFQGTWSNYPFFESGTHVVTSIERGLFILKEQDTVTKQ